MSNLHGTDKIIRRKLYINGIVQGVGFRPFIYRIANENKLAGFVNNDSQGVIIEIEGLSDNIEIFEKLLESDLPPLAKIDIINIEDIKIKNDKNFEIKTSQAVETANTLISPDIATCDKCLEELFNPDDRRYQYPFINCTNCGPRYTIIDSIPYDRPFTSMKIFPMCE
ncbi:MAG: acylphosphatase, partial [candidate division Zixibacteria bacterium]|nr:acylphosphatase [candidate division Zixibacteria bacterium]